MNTESWEETKKNIDFAIRNFPYEENIIDISIGDFTIPIISQKEEMCDGKVVLIKLYLFKFIKVWQKRVV